MKNEILDNLKNLKKNIEKVQKLNEDLIENHLAKKNKITHLEKKIQTLKKGIKENADQIEKFIKDTNANS